MEALTRQMRQSRPAWYRKKAWRASEDKENDISEYAEKLKSSRAKRIESPVNGREVLKKVSN
jgi:hypothetical protein